jgi:hypothetical protein
MPGSVVQQLLCLYLGQIRGVSTAPNEGYFSSKGVAVRRVIVFDTQLLKSQAARGHRVRSSKFVSDRCAVRAYCKLCCLLSSSKASPHALRSTCIQ